MNNRVRYIDTPAIVQVIGCVYQNPKLIEDESYTFSLEDFTEDFHKVVFGSIYNLFQLGAEKITTSTIETYLEQRPEKLAIYKVNNGEEYLERAALNCQLAAFNYYYHRMRKFTLLRIYNERAGMDLSWLYDINNIFDQKKKQNQEDWLDNHTEEEIGEIISQRIEEIKFKYTNNTEIEIIQAGEGSDELWDRLHKYPDVGYPLYGKLINTITRGARLGKFYLRSAATNVGKSRAMIADCCNIACDEIYDVQLKQWVKNNTKEPAVYIMTEQIYEEVQTMIWSFLSGVPEDNILTNRYNDDEEERVIYAKELVKRCSGFHLIQLHDFSLKDIENTIRYIVKKLDTRYIFLDYIHSSMKILSEVSSRASVKGLREDNVLFMVSVRLKDLATQYGVFILSSTQLNGDYTSATIFDQNLLRGAKSIADKIDFGCIMLRLTEGDKEVIDKICKDSGFQMPNLKISIYKNRRGKYNHVLVWCYADLSICRINPLFVTEYDYSLLELEDYQINVIPNENERSAF